MARWTTNAVVLAVLALGGCTQARYPTAPQEGAVPTRGARIIDAKNSTIVGTPKQIKEFLAAVTGSAGAVIVDFKDSQFVLLSNDPEATVPVASAKPLGR